MNASEIRKAFLDYMAKNGHTVIPRANLVPQNDPTTLFTGSGMQPLVPYLLGENHPSGNRVANSQTCLRAEDIEEIGDMCHTTFFEMLGNWSFGNYWKEEQLAWLFEFLTDKVGLEPSKLYVTCFSGDKEVGIPPDEDSARKWKELFSLKNIEGKIVEIGSKKDGGIKGMQDGRIFYYDAGKNWWSRAGTPKEMPAGEPGGPDSEVFYRFSDDEHSEEEKKQFGEQCHPNCECGRFLEIGNSVFMQYIKREDGSFGPLPKNNIDFGGGLERIAAAKANNPDVFKIDLLWPIIQKLEELSSMKYDFTPGDLGYETVPECWIKVMESMRVIADHLRAAVWLAVDGVVPSNKVQGYVMRRLMRRAIRYALELKIEQDLCERIVPTIIDIYQADYPEAKEAKDKIIDVLTKEEKIFRQTLKKGLKEFEGYFAKIAVEYDTKVATPEEVAEKTGQFVPLLKLTGEILFKLYDTYGFPIELSKEEAINRDIKVDDNAEEEFNKLMQEQRQRSQTAAQGAFRGGLADSSEMTTKYHTAAHLLMQALRSVLGDHVSQKGSNITAERLRLDFSHPEKVTPEQLAEVEKIVNEKIQADLPVTCSEQDVKQAMAEGAQGVFGDKYGDKVKVYSIGDFSKEICGGPHIDHTGQLAEGDKKFRITKEESSSAGVRRIKAVLA